MNDLGRGAWPIGAAIKGTGALLSHVGYAPRQLEADRLMAEAAGRAGFEDFGGDDIRPPLEVLLSALESEAALSAFGRFSAHQETLQLLENRLKIQAARRRHPAIGAQPIERPIFIAGLPRSGTTLLHGLLAQDPASRAPLTWETMEPPDAASGRHRSLETKAHWRIRSFHSLAPEFRRIHAVDALLPQECIAITAHSFLSTRFDNTYRIPSYQAWLDAADQAPAYAFHRAFLQHLQFGNAPKRWVLKAPAHLFTLEEIFAAYPDALVVHTHRDPLAVMASVASLVSALRQVFCKTADRHEVGAEMTERWGLAADRAVMARRKLSRSTKGEQVIDLHYKDLITDPMAAIRRIYSRFDLPLSEAVEQRMQGYLSKNPKGKHGRHHYTLDDFGLGADAVAARFDAYNRVFGVEAKR